MKILIKATVILVAICMLVGTIMIFLKDIKVLFTRESADYLSDISEVNHLFSVLFFIAYIAVAVLVFKKVSTQRVLILLLAMILWLMCGRVISFKAFPDGRIITGWYYIESNNFNLCEDDNDCETIISKGSTISKLSLWRIGIKNKYINKVIFIGPFTWHNCSKLFEKNIGDNARQR
jgi:hypothetical protein